MSITLVDKSNYLRGLLILAKKDNEISEFQRFIILSAGRDLGFSSSFCEEIVDTLLQNDCLCEDPIKFENYAVAQAFIADGIKITSCGKQIIEAELNWLKRAAEINSVNSRWFDSLVMNSEYMIKNPFATQLTLNSII